MASAGIRKHTSTRTGRISYEVWWRLDDGSQGSKSFAKKADASDYRGRVLTEAAAGRLDRRRASLRFREWVEDWWATWSTNPNRSPNTLVMTESRLRRYIRPHFDGRLVRSISVRDVQHWQNGLEATVGYDTVMACRSVLFRVLQAAEDEGIVPANPVRKVPAPKRLVDPEVIFGRVKRRTLTPEEAGILLARFPRFWWDHVITLLGTGLRIGEFTGLQRRRVDLAHGRLEVVETRYEAGKYGTGIKNRPKSPAGIRELPIPRQVADAIARQLPPGTDPSALVFSGPGGAAWRRRGERTVLSRFNVRRLYHQAVGRAAAGAAKTGGSGLAHLDLHGPHDLRHTYATWLEEEGIPVRVIDELMGHRAGSRGDRGGSSIGRRYRHTTPEMRDRVLAVLEIRLAITLEVANRLVEV